MDRVCYFGAPRAIDWNLSCDNDHVCQENAEPGQPCEHNANGIDCVPVIGVIVIGRDISFAGKKKISKTKQNKTTLYKLNILNTND